MTNQPTQWDLDILEDIYRSIVRKLDIIGDLSAGMIVRDTVGDSRPITVFEMKADIERLREEGRSIKRQFPDYFGL